VYEDGAHCSLDSCLWVGWTAKFTKVDTRDELLARILDAVAHVKKKRDFRTRFAKCFKVDGEIFEKVL